jgi:glycosyltransferase involved in cell wall biosynthesis
MTSADQRAKAAEAPSPFFSVIVPVLNREATITRCLASLLRASYPQGRREIVVVDNGSTDRTAHLVRGYPVRLVVEPRRGLSQARNRGIQESEGEVLAFTDSDCYVSNRWLADLTEGLREDGVAAVTGDVVPYPPATPVERYSAKRKPSTSGWQQSISAPWFNFMNTAVRREVFDRVGLFDPRFPGAGEDIDFAWRFFAAGLRLSRRPQPVVFHSQRATVEGLFRQQLRNGRAWALLLRKHPDVTRWGWRDELTAWADLARSTWSAAGVYVRTPVRPQGSVPPEYLHLDLVSKIGRRLGFLDGQLRSRF